MKKEIANIITITCLLLLILTTFIGLFIIDFDSYTENKILSLIVLALCLILYGSSYVIYKSFFLEDKRPGNQQPLFIPKIYGMGIALNPNHPVGRFIWIVLGVALFGLFVWRIF